MINKKEIKFKKINDKINIDCGDYILYGIIVGAEYEMYSYAVEFTNINGDVKVMHCDMFDVIDDTIKFTKLNIEP